MIGRAMVAGTAIEPHLSSAFLKQLLGRSPNLRDLEQIDTQMHSSLRWILDNSLGENRVTDLTFTRDFDDGGVRRTVELKQNGSQCQVTDENKDEYVSLVVEHRLRKHISGQLVAFLQGFHEMIPLEDIRFFRTSELDLLICGVPEIDVADFQANCRFVYPYHGEHPVIRLFFEVIGKWDGEKLAKLLIYVTGSSRVPVGGFAAFKHANHPITIASGGTRDRLPAAHTCVCQLDLPEYATRKEMSVKLEYAISECAEFDLL
jgi:hypothetical protein